MDLVTQAADAAWGPVLTFPAPNLEFLAWFGLVPGLVLIVRSPTAREGGMRAWWLGAGYLIAALYWMTPEIGPAVLLVGAVVGALWIPFGVAAWKLLRPPVTAGAGAPVVVPSCWLLLNGCGPGRRSAARGRCSASASGSIRRCSRWPPWAGCG